MHITGEELEKKLRFCFSLAATTDNLPSGALRYVLKDAYASVLSATDRKDLGPSPEVVAHLARKLVRRLTTFMRAEGAHWMEIEVLESALAEKAFWLFTTDRSGQQMPAHASAAYRLRLLARLADAHALQGAAYQVKKAMLDAEGELAAYVGTVHHRRGLPYVIASQRAYLRIDGADHRQVFRRYTRCLRMAIRLGGRHTQQARLALCEARLHECRRRRNEMQFARLDTALGLVAVQANAVGRAEGTALANHDVKALIAEIRFEQFLLAVGRNDDDQVIRLAAPIARAGLDEGASAFARESHAHLLFAYGEALASTDSVAAGVWMRTAAETLSPLLDAAEEQEDEDVSFSYQRLVCASADYAIAQGRPEDALRFVRAAQLRLSRPVRKRLSELDCLIALILCDQGKVGQAHRQLQTDLEPPAEHIMECPRHGLSVALLPTLGPRLPLWGRIVDVRDGVLRVSHVIGFLQRRVQYCIEVGLLRAAEALARAMRRVLDEWADRRPVDEADDAVRIVTRAACAVLFARLALTLGGAEAARVHLRAAKSDCAAAESAGVAASTLQKIREDIALTLRDALWAAGDEDEAINVARRALSAAWLHVRVAPEEGASLIRAAARVLDVGAAGMSDEDAAQTAENVLDWVIEHDFTPERGHERRALATLLHDGGEAALGVGDTTLALRCFEHGLQAALTWPQVVTTVLGAAHFAALRAVAAYASQEMFPADQAALAADAVWRGEKAREWIAAPRWQNGEHVAPFGRLHDVLPPGMLRGRCRALVDALSEQRFLRVIEGGASGAPRGGDSREESRDVSRDVSRDESRDVSRDELRDVSRDESRDVSRDD